MSKSTKYGAVGVVIVAVLAFIISGVLASTSITVNSANTVTLGAGAAYATTCDGSVTVTPLVSFNSSTGIYQLTTMSIKDIGESACDNKTLSLAFLSDNTAYFASWPIGTAGASKEYHFGSRSGGSSGTTYFATSTLSALSAAGLTSIAVSIN